ncbi:hypothetical protein BC567DRAFT_226116 [Phyllosticta citribraziliensis]
MGLRRRRKHRQPWYFKEKEAGGLRLPRPISRTLLPRSRWLNPFRSLVGVVNTASSRSDCHLDSQICILNGVHFWLGARSFWLIFGVWNGKGEPVSFSPFIRLRVSSRCYPCCFEAVRTAICLPGLSLLRGRRQRAVLSLSRPCGPCLLVGVIVIL